MQSGADNPMKGRSTQDRPMTDQFPDAVREVVDRYWQRLEESPLPAAQALRELMLQDSDRCAQLLRVWAASDYAANVILQWPDILMTLIDAGSLDSADPDFAEDLRTCLRSLGEGSGQDSGEACPDALKAVLRRFHTRQMLRIIWRDVCGMADVRTTCREVSLLAEAALDETLALLHQWSVQAWGEPRDANGVPQRMVVIGMGKLGAGELNLSSDIDLIFAYPEAGETAHEESAARESITNQEFFLRLGQRLIEALDAVTRDGFVFRVDMRLRPYGSDGALVCSFDAMENYYQVQGRDWERYAMIKARTVAGDRRAGAALLLRLRPFVYRRYLDFSAFEALRSLKTQINKQVRRKGMSEDIKLGRGGIREAEFVIQALQLVHGGRDRSLQQASLYAAMSALGAAGCLPPASVEELSEAYTFLRDLENKLQAFANKQTQALPRNPVERQRIAAAMGFDDWPALFGRLEHWRAVVDRQFHAVIQLEEDEDINSRHEVDDGELPALWQQHLDDETAIETLRGLGFEEPDQTWQLILSFRKNRNFVTLPAESRQRFNRFMPLMLATLACEQTPSRGFVRVMKMVEAVARRTAYLVLLIENPAAMQQFVRLCTASPFIADFLSLHPVLLDELLGGIDQPPEKSELQDELKLQIMRMEETNFEAQMEFLRYFKQSHTLQVAAAQISGTLTVMKVSDYLTFIAEAILGQVIALSWQHLVRKHGYPVNTRGEHGEMDFVIIAYGKLGGIELSYISDLDLVFLHDGALDEETRVVEGQRAINSREFYTRLAQRVITMLDTHTMSGRLYEVDMRLRPSGESGLLVSSLPAFEKYQTDEAWTWEHQALVRARAVAGSERLSREFGTLRASVLSRPRDVGKLADDVLGMRKRMRDELTRKAGAGASSPPFQIKQGEGGIVDIEFMVQFLVLSGSRDHESLLRWSDNMRILESIERCGLLSADDTRMLMEAYLALRSALHRFALQESDLEQPLVPLEPHRENVARLWQQLFADWLGEPA